MLDDHLVSRETRDRMWTKAKTTAGEELDYGYGFSIGAVDGSPVVGHSGAQSRVRTRLRIWPESGTVVAIMCNLEG